MPVEQPAQNGKMAQWSFKDVREAIAREKQLKKWRRQWKIDLIERHNATWEDLFPHTIT